MGYSHPAQNGAAQNGTKQNGAEQNGTEQNGAKQNGTEQNGTEQNGAEQNGTEQNGTEQNGAELFPETKPESKNPDRAPKARNRHGVSPEDKTRKQVFRITGPTNGRQHGLREKRTA